MDGLVNATHQFDLMVRKHKVSFLMALATGRKETDCWRCEVELSFEDLALPLPEFKARFVDVMAQQLWTQVNPPPFGKLPEAMLVYLEKSQGASVK